MTTGIDPYVTPPPTDTSGDPDVLETEIVVAQQNVDLGGGVFANAETYNGSIPGPTLRLKKDNTLIVRLINDLPHGSGMMSGIHWHGIEMASNDDGTPVTQNGVPVGPFTPPNPGGPTGGTYLYKFKVPRPGLYWYHAHHYHSTNRTIRGTYGMIVIEDLAEAGLISAGVLPGSADTLQLVLSDITVCKTVGSNESETYPDPTLLPVADRPEWLSGSTAQPGPSPEDLCELSPVNEDGLPTTPYGDQDVPNIQKSSGRTNEGQLVLTNGMNVGGRLGTPAVPGALDVSARVYDVNPGQGLRLQIVNCATTRYFRLRLTQDDGTQIDLVRVGGEGGLLNTAVVEGGVISGFDTKYDSGEILLPPASRADVVVSIPTTATGVLTLWTRDYERMGGNFSQIPTVPVAHFRVTGAAVPAFSLAAGDEILDSVGASISGLPGPFVALKDPATFSPAKPGMSTNQIEFTNSPGPSIDGVAGSFGGFPKYTDAPHIPTSRYAETGTQIELEITNTTGTNHPFHLHGFSVQPIRLEHPSLSDYVWPYVEYRDTIDIPPDYKLVCRLDLAPRVLNDEVTLGGEMGRWLFHCHIFFHAHRGMLAEFVVTDANGREKPYVDVGGSWAYTPLLGVATRRGTYAHLDGDTITLESTLADGTSIGTVTDLGSGQWRWELDTSVGPEPASTRYIYITATDGLGHKDQTVFRLKIGAPDDGADNGDPHIHTVDGQRYDFQGVGEFVCLRDREGMEVQTRQTPVTTANPITDPYSGLRACVSLNTAVALSVGNHRIAYQPTEQAGELQFFVDGKPTRLASMVLDGHQISSLDAEGSPGLRVDYAHGPIVMVTPRFWNSHGLWYMNVSVSHTQATEGLMGPIAQGSWLPRLRNGATVGPKPKTLPERYVALYKVFADSWRVTDETSLFVYAPGTSSTTFTDRDWPADEPPCEMKSQFALPGVAAPAGVPVAQAQQICSAVTEAGLNKDCVFDVAITGEEEFARGYEFAQKLKASATSIRLVGDHRCENGSIGVLAVVLPLVQGGATPKGSVSFTIDGEQGPTLPLDAKGRACLPLDKLGDGDHEVQAEFNGADGEDYQPAKSPTLVQPGRPKAPDGPALKPWYWLILLLLLVLLVLWVLF